MINNINLLTDQKLVVTWDLGRRCNYDCSYCPPNRHDKVSPYAELPKLKKTAKFVLDYCNTLVSYKKSGDGAHQRISIGFTGGEPTVHPGFLEFAHFINEEKKKFVGNYASIALTTNGQFSTIMAKNIVNNFDFATISYHCEALPTQKKKVLENIKFMHSKGFDLKVNVMFHAEYFDECVELCLYLDDLEIKYIPRLIGEHEDSKDSDAHKYTPKQQEWVNKYWGLKGKPKKDKKAREIGRPCCGDRTMEINDEGSPIGKRKTRFLQHTKFSDWYCSVNWFFLHIDENTKEIYHHQTCQARFDKTRGAIGKISEADSILNNLKNNLENNTMPIIVCPLGPGAHCGCGMCTPKSVDLFEFKNTLSQHVDNMQVFNM